MVDPSGDTSTRRGGRRGKKFQRVLSDTDASTRHDEEVGEPIVAAAPARGRCLMVGLCAVLSVVAAVSLLTQRSGARLLPFLVGGTGGLSIVTGAIWLQKTFGVLL